MTFVLLAAEPVVTDKLDFWLKAVQIAFYLVGGTVAVLTYFAAKKAWLTPTNTEYQKKVVTVHPVGQSVGLESP